LTRPKRGVYTPAVGSPHRFGRYLLPAVAAAIVGGHAVAYASASPDGLARYSLGASLAPDLKRLDGRVEVVLTNGSERTLRDAVFFLFANRFSAPDPGIDDFTRAYVYPREEFEPGGMEVVAAWDGERASRIENVAAAKLPAGTVVRMPIAPLAPGASRTLKLDFRTTIPERFGTFGTFEGELTAIGGWYPYLAALDPSGEWRLDAPPSLADFEVELEAPPDQQIVLNGLIFAPGERVRASLRSVHYLSLVAAPDFVRSETEADGVRLVFLHRPARRYFRLSLEPPVTELMLQTLHDAVAERPQALPVPTGDLVVVEAPLRLDLTAPGEGAVVVSDRSLKVHAALRPFHEVQIAQALYAETLRERLAASDAPADYPWLSEGVSRVLARRFFERARPDTRSVRDWIELFNVFAIVDRFESEPKIPFVGAFFDRAPVSDPLGATIWSFNREAPPGHVVLTKIRALVGPQAFDPMLDRCLASGGSLRACLIGEAGGQDLEPLLVQWLGPYPQINYRIDEARLNREEFGRRRSTVKVRRQSSRPYSEPVTVRFKTLGGNTDLQWKSGGDVAQMSAATDRRVYQVLIDPDHDLIEQRRDDDAWPPTPQIVLDTADVEVSSTEFSISGLVVGRARYDYRKDLALAAFYTNRSSGFTAGARYHWGEPIDATTYRNNLYAFYAFQSLDGGFKEKGRAATKTKGELSSFGLRYDYSNVFWYFNPTHERTLRLYADWYDGLFGSDYQYVDCGVSVTATQPLWSPRTIGAVEILNGFSEPLEDSRVPNQGLYSLGGSRSIRGIGAEDELGENIFVLRAELRQDLYPEFDHNLLDLLVVRRTQLRVFVDTGRVHDSPGHVYDVGQFAAGVGVGFEAFYDFLGFFPASAYIELATRVDEPSKSDDVQVLFGTRQAF
jgi:Omp85 superfamily domain